MDITIYIDNDGTVTFSDLPLELCDIIQKLNSTFFLCNNIGKCNGVDDSTTAHDTSSSDVNTDLEK